jgi:hypothetical protein
MLLRAIAPILCLLTLPLSLAGLLWQARRTAPPTVSSALLSRLPSSDLALVTLSRATRSPSTEEPSAAIADAPMAPDADVANGALGLAAAVLFESASP